MTTARRRCVECDAIEPSPDVEPEPGTGEWRALVWDAVLRDVDWLCGACQ